MGVFCWLDSRAILLQDVVVPIKEHIKTKTKKHMPKNKSNNIPMPCYCCGKETPSYVHNIITKDGSNMMSHEEWKKFCAEHNYNPADPRTAMDLCGVKWRPETFGSTCYKKQKSANKSNCVEITTDDGVKWLFIR